MAAFCSHHDIWLLFTLEREKGVFLAFFVCMCFDDEGMEIEFSGFHVVGGEGGGGGIRGGGGRGLRNEGGV